MKIVLNLKRKRKISRLELLQAKVERIYEVINKYFVISVDKAGYVKRQRLTIPQQEALIHILKIKRYPPSPELRKAIVEVRMMMEKKYKGVSKNPIKSMIEKIEKIKDKYTPKTGLGEEIVPVETELKFTKGGLEFFSKYKVIFVNRRGIAVKPIADQVLACYAIRNRKPVIKLDFTQMSEGTIRVMTNKVVSTDMRDANRLFITKNYRTILNNTGYLEGKTIRDCLAGIDFSKLTQSKVAVSWFAFFNQGDTTIRVSDIFTLDPSEIRVKGSFKMEMKEGNDPNNNRFVRFMGAIRRKVEKTLIDKLLERGYTFTSLNTLQDFIERDATLGYESPLLEERVEYIENGDVREFGLKGFRFGIKFERIPDTKNPTAFKKNSLEYKIASQIAREWAYYNVKFNSEDFKKELKKRVHNAKKGGKYGKEQDGGIARVSEEPVAIKVTSVRSDKVSKSNPKRRKRKGTGRLSKKR